MLSYRCAKAESCEKHWIPSGQYRIRSTSAFYKQKKTFKAPPTAEVQALIPAEIAKVKELTEQGLIAAAYTAADLSSVWVVWNVDSQAALEETHSTLPLHP